MKKEVEFLLAYYSKTVVDKIYTFETVDQLRDHLITLLQHPPIEDVEVLTIKEIIGHVNKRWNCIDANEWRLSYMINDKGIAKILFNN